MGSDVRGANARSPGDHDVGGGRGERCASKTVLNLYNYEQTHLGYTSRRYIPCYISKYVYIEVLLVMWNAPSSLSLSLLACVCVCIREV